MTKLSSIVAATLLSATAAFAAPITKGSTGDYLVVPAYYANTAGWTSNLKVTNTDTANAVVAKVVIREGGNSKEVRDFLIYLSPGDVWEATMANVNGAVNLSSTDDSTVFNGVMTSTTNAFSTNMVTSTAANEDVTAGYIEVFGVAKIAGASVTAGWTVGTPLSKTAIVTAYANAALPWADVGTDLYATQTVSTAGAGSELSVNIPTVAFNNFAETSRQGTVIAGQNTTLALMTEKAAAATLTEIDALLATNTAYVNYSSNGTTVNETALYVNTPTKKYWYTELAGTLTTKGYTKVGTSGVESDWVLPYSITCRDQMENTPSAPVASELSGDTPIAATTATFKKELSVISVSGNSCVAGYKDGVAQVNLTAAPVIPVLMSAVTVGARNITSASSPVTK